MLDSKYIEENMDKVREKLAERGAEIDFEEFWALDRGRKEIIKKVEKLERERNIGSKKVGGW